MITEKQMAVSTVWIVKTIFVCPFIRGGTESFSVTALPLKARLGFGLKLGNIEDGQWHDVHVCARWHECTRLLTALK